MSIIRLNINGQEVAAREGHTVLEACRENGIRVPTLCHLEGLTDVGGCRMCIVNIEGQGRPVPACTTPAADEMVIQTDTPALEELRRQTLELLFSERNHICPFCPLSGNCELQTAAYEHQIDHLRYDYCFPVLPMDNSHSRIALDHNRCILCTRCIRACDEWVGAHVLDLDHRGLKTMLIADNGVPLGESTCVSCGTCVSVCPTGALFEKRSAHWQGRAPREMLETICPGCGVGCRIYASVRHRQVGEIKSAGGPSGNRVLCERGRFELVEPRLPRLTEISIRQGGRWVERSIRDVLAECVRRLSSAPVQADPSRVVAFMSPRLPLETLAAGKDFIARAVGSPRWGVLDRTNTPAVQEALGINGRLVPLAGLSDLDESDMFLLVGANLDASHGVVASYVRRAALHRRVKLAKINPRHTWLTDWTDVHLRVERGKDALILSAILKYLIDMGRVTTGVPQELRERLNKLDEDSITGLAGVPAADIRRIAEMYAQAQRPMLICGMGLTRHGPEGLAAALALVKATGQRTPTGRWRLMEVAMGANSVGGRLLGHSGLSIHDFNPHTADVAFVLLGDEERPWPREALDKLRAVSFVVAMAARRHGATEAAHVVIPTATWAERGGTYVNLEGRVQRGQPLLEPAPVCVDEAAFFEELARAWRGPDCAWMPPGIPENIRQIGDGHMVPCETVDGGADLSGLAALTEE